MVKDLRGTERSDEIGEKFCVLDAEERVVRLGCWFGRD